ncbi:uncharacterized protein EV420DRAFT_481353 [Desarmillaria tabescens]|uniref:Uncharacterized protein n=1 Tax=Armillaria tabescens TaxID=1929756 RepID=A0AA39KB46_ARMTA|nr:uncharacterized protein EV420DRAFT_481353 [Desarmillaria tabescens]KAK0457840.1 hypothetical protein EV420DRAFT_481353 [Desarmillaria tabescens]
MKVIAQCVHLLMRRQALDSLPRSPFHHLPEISNAVPAFHFFSFLFHGLFPEAPNENRCEQQNGDTRNSLISLLAMRTGTCPVHSINAVQLRPCTVISALAIPVLRTRKPKAQCASPSMWQMFTHACTKSSPNVKEYVDCNNRFCRYSSMHLYDQHNCIATCAQTMNAEQTVVMNSVSRPCDNCRYPPA